MAWYQCPKCGRQGKEITPDCPMCEIPTKKIPTPKVKKKVRPTSNLNMPVGHKTFGGYPKALSQKYHP